MEWKIQQGEFRIEKVEFRIGVHCTYDSGSLPTACRDRLVGYYNVFLISGLVLYPMRMAFAVNFVPAFRVIGFS